MSSLQVRDVPEQVARVLKVRASTAGQSLSEYVLAQLVMLTASPTIEELTARIATRGRVDLTTPAADILFETRADAR